MRIGEWVGAGASAIEDATAGLYFLIHLGKLPAHTLEIADRLAEGFAIARVADGFLESALCQAERNARVQAALRIERREQAYEAIVTQHQIFERQFAIFETNFV